MKKNSNTININKLIIIGIAFLFVLIIGKIFVVAISHKDSDIDLVAFANNRDTVKTTLYASRGTIYDINGEELASNANSYTVIAYLSSKRTTDFNNPKHVVDISGTAEALAPIINMSAEDIINLMSNDKLYQVELGPGGRGISELIKEEIEVLDLPGIDFIKSTTKRYYKMGNFASYIIGYAKKNDDGEIVGEMGIEKYFNDALKGTDGFTEYQKDAYGYQIPNTPSNTKKPQSGSDIYLTIDNDIQLKLENAIYNLTSEYNMAWITATIAEAKTGKIVASASAPNFNLNTLNINSYLTPLTQYAYEPGSTMKIFTYMAAMENGKYNGEELYKSGTLDVGDITIKDFNGVGWGEISYDQGFQNSSNVAAAKLAQKMGKKSLKTYYEKLGFGKKTGIALPNENSGKIAFNYDIEVTNASFGQGILTTPVQYIQALTSIANDGVILKPYVVEKIVNSDTGEITYYGEKDELGVVASKETINHMKELMYKTVNEGITDAKNFKTDNVTIIGKGGTAQIASNKGGYLTGEYDYIKSFAGLFPYEDPEYIVYVSAKQFIGSFKNVGKTIAGVVEDIASLKNITTAETETQTENVLVLKNYISKTTSNASEELESLKLVPIIIGEGDTIISQYPSKDSRVVNGNYIFLLTNNTTYRMPDFKNWSFSNVKNYCNYLRLKCQMNGYGYVINQSIPKGELITNKDKIEITLDNIYEKKPEIIEEKEE